MSEQSIHAGAAGATSDDPARAEASTPTDADSTTAGEESVRAAHGAAASQGADTDSVPSEADRS